MISFSGLVKCQLSKVKCSARGFTLLELLIVISIIAILSVALVIVLNPSEILKKSRDSQRIADLNTMKSAIGIYLTSTSVPSLTCWVATSTSATTTAAAQTSITGTGWIPINFTTLTGGSPISNLPVDPLNVITTSDYWYKCENTTNTFEVSAKLESAAYGPGGTDDKGAKDGGDDATRYEIGTKLNQ